MADTKISALTAATAAAAANELATNEVGTSKKFTVAQIVDYLFKRIAGNSGAAGAYKTLQNLTADSADNSTLIPAVVMTTTDVGVGTWHFRYSLIYQTAATATGIGFSINHTGTTGQFSMMWVYTTTGSTASTGVGDGIASLIGGQLLEGKSERTIDTVSSKSAGVDTINADVPAVLEGIIEVTGTGSLQLKMVTEIDTSAVRIMADSCLELTLVEV